jgi:8-oxo-dGTP diphosphatase
MNQAASAEVRCSAVVFRGQDILLVHRLRDGGDDWVLPGGTPLPGESMASCARRETLEEAGLAVQPARIAFVLETQGPRRGVHTLDLVFLAPPSDPGQEPRPAGSGLSAEFVPLRQLPQLDLRPPIAGHLRGLHSRGAIRTAAYLGNLWRPGRLDELPPVLVEFTDDQPSAADVVLEPAASRSQASRSHVMPLPAEPVADRASGQAGNRGDLGRAEPRPPYSCLMTCGRLCGSSVRRGRRRPAPGYAAARRPCSARVTRRRSRPVSPATWQAGMPRHR